jgi:hypothetical protein
MKPIQVNPLQDAPLNEDNGVACTNFRQVVNQNTPEDGVNLAFQTEVQPKNHESDDQAKLRWLQNRMKYPALGMCRR